MANAPKRRRYSLEPDVKIEVEGTPFELHSHLIMLASTVFRSMLEKDMSESEEGVIRLPGKRKVEFEAVLPFLSTLAEAPTIALKEVPMLLRWADEYDIAALRKACEQELLKHNPCVEFLHLSVRYGLSTCKVKCVEAITSDLRPHMDELEALVEDAAVMESVAPAMFTATKVLGQDVKVNTIAPISTRTYWPFIRETILNALDNPYSVRPQLPFGATVRVLSNVARLRHLCELMNVKWYDYMAAYAGQEVAIDDQTPSGNYYVKFDPEQTKKAKKEFDPRNRSRKPVDGLRVEFPWCALCPFRKECRATTID